MALYTMWVFCDWLLSFSVFSMFTHVITCIDVLIPFYSSIISHCTARPQFVSPQMVFWAVSNTLFLIPKLISLQNYLGCLKIIPSTYPIILRLIVSASELPRRLVRAQITELHLLNFLIQWVGMEPKIPTCYRWCCWVESRTLGTTILDHAFLGHVSF